MPLLDTLPSLPSATAWQMTWHDEFNGPSLDTSKWQIDPDGPRQGGVRNRRNVALDGQGSLVISGTSEGGQINGASIDTNTLGGRNLFTYGYFVARVLVAQEPGVNSAFWLQTKDAFTVNSPTHGTEIDVLEYPERDGRPNQNLHWGNYTGQAGTRANTLVNDGRFHTYGVWWTPAGYRFYVDGKQTWETREGGVSSAKSYILLSLEPMNTNIAKKMYALANLTAKPARFLVDYVRVYQQVPKH